MNIESHLVLRKIGWKLNFLIGYNQNAESS